MTQIAQQTLVEMLQRVAQEHAGQTAFVYLPDGEREADSVTFGQLDLRARALAARLVDRGLTGGRAVLAGPPGIDFVVALAGCFYAGVTAVPVVPESSGYQRRRQRLAQIVADCDPAIELTFGEPESTGGDSPVDGGVPRLAVAAVGTDGAAGFTPAAVTGESLAILQYTSGSTANPRGVMVTHRNVLANVTMLAGIFEQPVSTTTVNWLPLHHDMGLFGNVLRSLNSGVRCVLMPPTAFLRRPLRWLRAISDYRAFVSGAPNFAYDMCVRRISPPERETLDLSCWQVAFNGSEPVRAETLERFTEAFAPAGFRWSTFVPGYGLAEATLVVSGVPRGRPAAVHRLDAEALRDGAVVPADGQQVETSRQVSCGPPAAGFEVAVVDPRTRRRLPEDRVGELWLRGESVAAGYWGRPEESAEVFGARLARAGSSGRPWLRTGDLGAVVDGELVVTGRLKDLIIIRGANYYPQDIEYTVRESLEPNRAGTTAAFAEPYQGSERLVVVQEIRAAGLDLGQICDDIHKRVLAEHGVGIDRLVLVRPGQVPRTSSGKVQRGRCRELLAGGGLTIGYDDIRGPGAVTSVPGAVTGDPEAVAGGPEATSAPEAGRVTAGPDESLVREVRAMIAEVVTRPVEAIRVNEPLTAARVDSLYAAELQERLHQRYRVEIELTELFGAADLRELAAIVQRRQTGARTADPQDASTAAGNAQDRTIPATDGVDGADPSNLGQPLDAFPLTPLQEAYIAGRTPGFELGGVGTHVYLEYRHDGLDVERAAAAWATTVGRHDMLRAVITVDGRQRIQPELATPIQIDDLRELADAEQRVGRTRQRMSHQVLDPYTGPLFEVRVSRLPAGVTVVHLSFDLLILDASGVLRVLREWGAHYQGSGPSTPVAGTSFREFLLRREHYRARHAERIAAQLRERLDHLHPGPALPLAVDPATVGTPRFRRWRTRLDPDRWRRLERAAQVRGVTRAALLGAAFSEVLALHSEARPFSLTVTSFDRPVGQVGPEVVGEFTALLLVEVTATGGDFEDRLRDFAHQMATALQHRDVDGVALLRERMRHAEPGRPPRPLAPVVFTCLLEDVGDLDWLGERRYAISQTPQVWLDHQVVTVAGTPELVWDAVEELFPPGLLDSMFDTYLRLLRTLADQDDWRIPGRQLAGLPTLARSAWTEPLPGCDRLLSELVAERIRATPEAVAVIAGDRRLRYRQLGTASARLAHRLTGQGLHPGDLVAVALPKGWPQIVAVLAVLRAGGVYVPVDPDSTGVRLRQLLADSTARFVLADSTARFELAEAQVRVVPVDEGHLADHLDAPAPALPATGRRPDDLAYVIYTSGSTGAPKGVAVSHRSAANTVLDINDRFAVGEQDRVLGVTPLTFDLSVYDIFGALAAGATLVLPRHERRGDPAHWVELLRDERITIWNSVPPLLRLLVDDPAAAAAAAAAAADRSWARQLRLILLSGDWIGVGFAAALRRDLPQARLVSLGGATEGAIWSVSYEIDRVDPDWRSVPYGQALRGQQAMVLDADLEPRPVGVPGPLYLAGAGLARGYWGDPERTAASFPVHPGTGRRLYRTGDLARLLPDGELELLGREDNQIKVQGHRIEPGEVEAVLASHPQVRDAVVGAVGPRDGVRRLVAYVRLHRPDSVPAGQLREHVAGLLPRYLVPDAIRVVDSYPLTGNGKLDRLALFADDGRVEVATVEDRGEPVADPRVSKAVLRIVAGLAGVEASQVAPEVDFTTLEFTSVHQIRLANALEAEFGLRPRLDELYRMRRVADLVRFYQDHTGPEASAVPAVPGVAVAAPVWAAVGSAVPAAPEVTIATPVGVVADAVREVLADPAQRARFKQRHRERPAPFGTGVRVALPAGPVEPELYQRRSSWSFGPEPVGVRELAEWLSCLREQRFDDRSRYAWGSAGGIYPIDVLLQIHDGRVRGLAAGVYHYDPRVHTLTLLSIEPVVSASAHAADNRRLHDEAAFAVFLVADLDAVTPLYGELAERFCLIEAGSISQLLETWAPRHTVATCPIGVLDFTSATAALGLRTGQQLVYTLLGGRPPARQSPAAAASAVAPAVAPAPVPVPASLPAVAPAPASLPVPSAALEVDLNTPLRVVPASGLAAEARLDLPVRPAKPQAGTAVPASGAGPRAVLVTGATGFLGAHLVAELLSRTDATVYGLVRAADEAIGGQRLHQALLEYGCPVPEAAAGRLVAVTGDLAAFRLGLPADRYEQLMDEVDTIYHSGATVSWTSSYRQLAPANVAGTRRVIEFAMTGCGKHLVYVSTVAVFPFGGSEPVTESATLDHGGLLYGGYPQSKWVAERMVTRAAEMGVDVTVLRPGTISGRSGTGLFNPTSFVDLFLASCLRIGSAPQIEMPLDLTPVDYVGAATVELGSRAGGGGPYHLTNPAPLPLTVVYDLCEAAGHPLRRKPFDRWRERLLAPEVMSTVGLAPFAGYLSRAELDYLRMPPYESSAALAALAGTAVRCPAVDAELIGTYLAAYARCGLLPRASR